LVVGATLGGSLAALAPDVSDPGSVAIAPLQWVYNSLTGNEFVHRDIFAMSHLDGIIHGFLALIVGFLYLFAALVAGILGLGTYLLLLAYNLGVDYPLLGVPIGCVLGTVFVNRILRRFGFGG
jgi:hypothetical protein